MIARSARARVSTCPYVHATRARVRPRVPKKKRVRNPRGPSWRLGHSARAGSHDDGITWPADGSSGGDVTRASRWAFSASNDGVPPSAAQTHGIVGCTLSG
eukprot:2145373-Prymnesium_polylepis.1